MSTLDLFDLKGRRALITGSSQGIGLGLAEGLANVGVEVILNGRNSEKLNNEVSRLKTKGYDVHGVAFDVTNNLDVMRAIEKIKSEIGIIDILINNAGMQFRSSLEDYPDEKFEEILDVNVKGVFLVSKLVAGQMIKRGEGKIINISSITSEMSRPTVAPYAATKGALKMLTKGMCADWAKYGLQINAISPGFFKTPMNQALISNPEFFSWVEKRTPSGRWGNIDELVGAAIFLASKASSFVNGHTLYVDGGITSVL